MPDHLFRHPSALLAATFVSRPHRFSTICRLDGSGEEVESHLADPGRLRDVLVEGARLWLRGPFPPPRKLRYSTVMGEVGGVGVNLVAAHANALFPILLGQDVFPELATARSLVRLDAEVTLGKSRVDFVVHTEAASHLVEVKAMDLAVDGRAMWPDAPTSRGLKHIRLLEARARLGEPTAIVFVAGRGDVEGFSPAAHIDPAFAAALREAAAAGVQVLAVKVSWDTVGAFEPARLDVELS